MPFALDVMRDVSGGVLTLQGSDDTFPFVFEFRLSSTEGALPQVQFGSACPGCFIPIPRSDLFGEVRSVARGAARALRTAAPGLVVDFDLAPVLAPIAELPVPPLHDVRRLSYSALALFERCSYRYYAERVAGLRERRPAPGEGGGLAATEIGDAVHRLLELVDLRSPAPPPVDPVPGWYPTVTEEELARIGAFVEAYCGSELARRVATLADPRPERPFAFEHDRVLLHGRLDVLDLTEGRATVVDYKTNLLGDRPPEELVEEGYRLQRLVYALACFRAGAKEVEVVYTFLERPDAVVTTTFAVAEAPALEAELSAAIARIDAGEFVPTPGELACAGCPALEVVCAGPRLGGAASSRSHAVVSA